MEHHLYELDKMNLRHCFILLVLFSLMFFVSHIKCATFIEITVVNKITSNTPVEVTCEDKHVQDEDVSISLALNHYHKFLCKISLLGFGTAQCKCSVHWENNVHEFHSFVSSRDEMFCKKSCRWHLTNIGPILVDSSSDTDDLPTILQSYTWANALVDNDEASTLISNYVGDVTEDANLT